MCVPAAKDGEVKLVGAVNVCTAVVEATVTANELTIVVADVSGPLNIRIVSDCPTVGAT